ncbi:MAG: sulfotransferase [Bacteroidota bacterium]
MSEMVQSSSVEEHRAPDASDASWGPTFFVIGAQKAGTTSLHDWLIQHPEVCLPLHKETHYFEKRFGNGWAWYRDQFPCAAPSKLVGEVDPEYLYHPAAARRIREALGTPKLVAVLREPVARAYSQYRMSVARGLETVSFPEALALEAERLSEADARLGHMHFSYLARGRYAEQLDRYVDAFGRDALHLVRFEDLVSGEHGDRTYASICAHIGLRSDPAVADRSQRSNVASEPRSTAVRDIIYRRGRLRRWGGKLIPGIRAKKTVMRWLDRLNSRPARSKGAAWKAEVSGWVWDEAEREAVLLADRYGFDTTAWRQSYASHR